jgi:hypothetical protein
VAVANRSKSPVEIFLSRDFWYSGSMKGEGLGQLILVAWSIGVIPAARPSDHRSAHYRSSHYRPPCRSTCNASDTHGRQRSPHTRLRTINRQ